MDYEDANSEERARPVFCTVPRNDFFYFRSGSSRNSNSVLPLPFGIWKFSISPLRVASPKNVDFSFASTCNFQLLPLEFAPDSRTRVTELRDFPRFSTVFSPNRCTQITFGSMLVAPGPQSYIPRALRVPK